MSHVSVFLPISQQLPDCQVSIAFPLRKPPFGVGIWARGGGAFLGGSFRRRGGILIKVKGPPFGPHVELRKPPPLVWASEQRGGGFLGGMLLILPSVSAWFGIALPFWICCSSLCGKPVFINLNNSYASTTTDSIIHECRGACILQISPSIWSPRTAHSIFYGMGTLSWMPACFPSCVHHYKQLGIDSERWFQCAVESIGWVPRKSRPGVYK